MKRIFKNPRMINRLEESRLTLRRRSKLGTRRVREQCYPMRKTILIIGVIILLIGISLIVIVRLGPISQINKIETLNQQRAGEYVSSELVLSSPSVVVIRSPASDGGLVPSQDLNAIDSVNVGTYAIPYSNAISNVETYNEITGDYYYVGFSSSAPSTQIVVTNLSSTGGLIEIGIIALSGLGLIIAGIVVVIVGLVSKNPRKDPRAVI
jgi:hypothetical protein